MNNKEIPLYSNVVVTTDMLYEPTNTVVEKGSEGTVTDKQDNLYQIEFEGNVVVNIEDDYLINVDLN